MICIVRSQRSIAQASNARVRQFLWAAFATALLGCSAAHADAANGARLFVKRCGACHTIADVSTQLRVTPANMDAAGAALSDFLSQHSEAEASAVEIRDIVDHLKKEAAASQ